MFCQLVVHIRLTFVIIIERDRINTPVAYISVCDIFFGFDFYGVHFVLSVVCISSGFFGVSCVSIVKSEDATAHTPVRVRLLCDFLIYLFFVPVFGI